ncbi:MBL fold metallo-hydrolase [uncultured Methylibium sp.]|uniref:MBL fold metallo-hydrolase n=1 Tax=uncultured Methylibium sp. TaxID=381093 RepID=UPI0025FE4FB2|nr:MBL fold metallo-hydrolase [uncultured Methylibium sp.]
MNALEHQLRYPFGDTLPGPGSTLTVAPGVKWLRMGLPFALDHINLWLLRDRHQGREGWAIVDCGIHNDATRAAWEQVFATQLEGLPVLRVIVTHMHPDHIGLADWLTQRWDCDLWISATDWNAARLASQPGNDIGGEASAAHYARHGVTDEDTLAKVRARTNYYASMVPTVPRRYHRLLDGQVLRIGDHDWRCHAGYGHAPEHIALHAQSLNLLISGDMVLPRISTNVMVMHLEPEADPLALFLASIERMRALPADAVVLPSHGRPFTGLHTRIDQLRDHHADRLAEVMEACTAQPTHAVGLLPVLFRRPLDLHQTSFALGEAIAHLHTLWLQGRLERRLDADGIYRFVPAA